MKWRARLGVMRWHVELIDDLDRVRCWMSPDQFGEVRFYGGEKDLFINVGFAAIKDACATARVCLPPGSTGRYHSRCSALRGQLCELIAATLNDRAVFSVPSASEAGL